MANRYAIRERVIFDVVDSETDEVLTSATERNTAQGIVERLDAGQIRHTPAGTEFFERREDDTPPGEPPRDVGASNVT